jgi:hypothetical protein
MSKVIFKSGERFFAFSTGFFSAFGFRESRLDNVAQKLFQLSDEDNLRRDFNAAGNDIREAMETLKKEKFNLHDCEA